MLVEITMDRVLQEKAWAVTIDQALEGKTCTVKVDLTLQNKTWDCNNRSCAKLEKVGTIATDNAI